MLARVDRAAPKQSEAVANANGRHYVPYEELVKSPASVTFPARTGNLGTKSRPRYNGGNFGGGRGARTEVLIEFGPDDYDDLLEVMVEAQQQAKEAVESNEACGMKRRFS